MLGFKQFAFVIITALTLNACQDSSISPSGRINADQLDKSQADLRAARLSNVNYIMDFDLASNPEQYQAEITINFTLSDNNSPLTIDFSGGNIINLNVNNAQQATDYNGFFITISADDLIIGENNISVQYSHGYNHDGTGLHKFVDPEDGETYIYSYLWPYYANRLFPSFDQPNLKATYTMNVTVPSNWVVSSAMSESGVEEQGQVSTWHFPTSDKFSTYVFSLHAGAYKVWQDTAETPYGDVPIRLFARQSMAEFVDAEEWFNFTKQGLNFYGEYFAIPYPFHKYDQLIVPDFNIGAMENVAAVTFAESYVPRGSSNRRQRERRAGTILHEMAHMWFGDLVTKSWWNGLWLNESFATYMSSLALSQATEFSDSWHGFYLGSNLSAFRADTLVTTHPIEVPVDSTADFFSIFDSITYGKGASALNQLSHFVGADNYRDGVRDYLKEFSYKNTELEDFIAFQSKSYGQDLTPWAQQWLYQAGVNTLEPEITCEDGYISQLSIKQSAPDEHPFLRSHRLQVGLYGFDGDNITTIAKLPVTITGENTVVDGATGLNCPHLIDPNDGDWAYAQLVLDDVTIGSLTTLMGEIDSPLRRSMYWYTLGQMSGLGQMEHKQLLSLISTHIEGEDNERVFNQVLGILSATVAQMNRLDISYDLSTIENQLWRIANDHSNDIDRRNLALKAYIDHASGENIATIDGLLAGNITISALDIDQELRWDIIVKLNRDDIAGAKELLAQERLNDQSYGGESSFIAAQASQPNLEVKAKWLEIFLDDDSEYTSSRQAAAMGAMFTSSQTNLHGQLLGRIVAALPELGRTRDAYYLRNYTTSLLSGVCTPESVALLNEAIEGGNNTNSTVLKFLREAHQRDSECVSLR